MTLAQECRFTYRSSAARITSDRDSLRDSATSRAADHVSSGTRNERNRFASLAGKALAIEVGDDGRVRVRTAVRAGAARDRSQGHAVLEVRYVIGVPVERFVAVHGSTVYTAVYTRKDFRQLFSEAAA